MTYYLTTDEELSAIADTIRSEVNISSTLTYPAGYINTIQEIKAAGGSLWAGLLDGESPIYLKNPYVTKMSYSFPSAILSNLYEVELPNCSNVLATAFSEAVNLSKINFSLCEYIGTSAFRSCTALERAEFPVCSSMGSGAFYHCAAMSEAIFPMLSSVPQYAFYNCTNLTDLRIPHCKYISTNTFTYCYNLHELYLTSATIYNSAVITLLGSASTFYWTGRSTSLSAFRIYVPENYLSRYKTATNWTYYSASIFASETMR